MSTQPPTSPPTFPVVEIFGPTIQGEGPEAGRPAHFVRFGGCDFRCSWCDSMFAVDPDQVRSAERLTSAMLAQRVDELDRGPRRVILTGGNPVLFDLAPLVSTLHAVGYKISVETQGTLWRDWLRNVDQVVISPKPPSSGMEMGALHARFMRAVQDCHVKAALKVVIFDDDDLAWLMKYRGSYYDIPLYLSVGLPPDVAACDVGQEISARYSWLCEQVARRRELSEVVVLPQLHVVAWGTVRGV